MPILVVKRLVKNGHEKDYEHSLFRLMDHAESMDGYMGITVARPVKKGYPLYIFSAKFDTIDNLNRFKESEYRKNWLKELHEITQEPITEKTLKGLNWWVVLPSVESDISRIKMFILTVFAAYPIILLFNIFIYPNEHVAMLATKTFLIVLLTISVMTYITLPLLLKIFAKWLYSKHE